MAVRYNTINHDMYPAEREYIEDELTRVADLLKNFPRPTYHVEVERSARKGGYGVSVHVNLSTRSLFATTWGSELRGAVEGVTDKLVRQAKKHLSVLRKDEHPGADSPKQMPVFREPTVADLEAIRDLEDFTDQIGHHAARLHKVLRREMQLDPRAAAAGGSVSVADLVEDAVAYVFEHFREKPKELTPDRWLVRRGLIFLDAELDRAASAADPTPEARVEPQEDWEELWDLPVMEYLPLDRQPADANRASPEIVGDRQQAQKATAAALSGLPTQLRTSLVLRHIEGYEIPEIAFVLNTDDARVEGWLDEAEVRLQEQLKTWRPA
jgi:ribosome-associated translation inhibitor RaiA/DNA-directed RNA polymerase specialized sigma24 family protein